MNLSEQDIQDIILNNPNKELIQAGCKYNKTMRLHLYGEGMNSHLTLIEGFEKPALRELRVKYAKSNKDLFARLARPIDKVFSARGGSTYFNLPDTLNKQAMSLASTLKDGISVKKWIENVWKPHHLDDPNGLLFMEIDGQGNVYPTYKAITSIYDYKLSGLSIDYVVFEVTNKQKAAVGIKEEEKVYRVVDDLFDYYVKKDGERIVFLEGHTYPNYFGRVPAMLNSDIFNTSDAGVVSLFDDVITLADQFLLKSSIKETHDFLHGYPKYWEYADNCGTCQGIGYVGAEKCNDCKGSGKKLMTKVSDAKLLSYPTKEDVSITPYVAGYVSPDKTYYEIATAELLSLESAMNFTIWGLNESPKTQGLSTDGNKTATEIVSDQQPKIDRLSMVADSAEKRHKFILDCIIDIKLKQGYSLSGGASVNYGRRFMIESPDAIWDRYTTARKDGASMSVLDDILMEFIETKYSGDPVNLAIQKKLLVVEPFVHNTVDEIKEWPCTSFEKQRKAYYSDWLGTKKPIELLGKDAEILKKELSDFVVEQSKQAAINKDDTPLAVKLGVGGTQALQMILGDAAINEESKRNILQILFGISPEDAERMVVKVEIVAPDPNNPNDPGGNPFKPKPEAATKQPFNKAA